jgi:ribosomal-protein-alanine N-acetyltransferase
MAGPWYPEDWPEPELSWTFLPEFQGRGYAMEASARSLAWAYDELGWATAISAIAPGNDRSVRLAQRLGARHEGATEVGSFGALDIWRHLPPADFRAHLGRLH